MASAARCDGSTTHPTSILAWPRIRFTLIGWRKWKENERAAAFEGLPGSFERPGLGLARLDLAYGEHAEAYAVTSATERHRSKGCYRPLQRE